MVLHTCARCGWRRCLALSPRCLPCGAERVLEPLT
jgi:hypothetical protein